MSIQLTIDQIEAVMRSVADAESLWGDLAEFEKNGLDTGFKKGVPASGMRAAQKALRVLNEAAA